MTVPHLVQYQGSKRLIAKDIIKYIQKDKYKRIVEPFAGTCAISLACAVENKTPEYWLNDANAPLAEMMRQCIEAPEKLADEYAKVWSKQFDSDTTPVEYYYKVRADFNVGEKTAGKMLFILARVVKGAVRYSADGIMNQSCDKRRNGTKPATIRSRAKSISNLLKGKAKITAVDYTDVLKQVSKNDLVYLDPPYQGTSESRDKRYFQGVRFDEFVEQLRELNRRGIDYIVSYDGMTGDKKIGQDLPDDLNLAHIYIDAGKSAQATLNGKSEHTYESLYLSQGISNLIASIELSETLGYDNGYGYTTLSRRLFEGIESSIE